MCDLGHQHHGDFGFIVDVPEIRALIDETRRLSARFATMRRASRRYGRHFRGCWRPTAGFPMSSRSLTPQAGWAAASVSTALYRDEGGELCLFSLVVPAGSSTPVHDHLAWGLVGVYRGAQLDTTYARLDDGSDEAKATLQVASAADRAGGRLLHVASAGRRYSLREDGIGDAVRVDSPACERHRMHLAPQVRSPRGNRDRFQVGLLECEVPAGTAVTFSIEPGSAHPFGTTTYPDGVNFSLFSEAATEVALLLFDQPSAIEPAQIIRLDPFQNKTFHFWHVFVRGCRPGNLLRLSRRRPGRSGGGPPVQSQQGAHQPVREGHLQEPVEAGGRRRAATTTWPRRCAAPSWIRRTTTGKATGRSSGRSTSRSSTKCTSAASRARRAPACGTRARSPA